MAKTKVTTPRFRASYVHIWQPQEQKNDAGETKKVYGLTMLFPENANLDELKAICSEAKAEKFGAATKGIKMPFRRWDATSADGEPVFDIDKNPEYKGCIIVTARSYDRPIGVIDRDRNVLQYPDDADKLYSGCYCLATLTAYGYQTPKGGKGVAFGLSSLMVVGNGEPLVSRSNPEDDFKTIDVSKYIPEGEDKADSDDEFDI